MHSRGACLAHLPGRCRVVTLRVPAAEDCNTLYGLLNATVLEASASNSAGDCCNSCKTTSGCSAWSYCYCEDGCAGNIAKGTCQLKSMTNAFYPR